ncbi:MAG: hypothetical protein HZC41_01680 [Chloroflexi bacterium]|nr:hypothetical protein [Chloroflexota bacterium]
MDRRTGDGVNEHMRARLLVNRHGKLTSEQWKDMVTEPLAALGLLLLPGIVILGPRLGALLWGGFALVALGALLALGVALALRARRYARAPVHFAVLRAVSSPPFWAFWQPLVFETEAGEPKHFGKRLAPYTRLRRDRQYLVYFLQEASTNVLLSLAPADHPDAALWQPSTHFQRRFEQRR